MITYIERELIFINIRHESTKRIDLKGAKLRFGEAKPDFKERRVSSRGCLFNDSKSSYIKTNLSISRIALENKAATERPPPKKRRRMDEDTQAEDMSLVTSENVNDRDGWKVSSVGRITRPVKTSQCNPKGRFPKFNRRN